jgi:hypothetical protein
MNFLMKRCRYLLIIAAALATSGCQMKFDVDVVVRDGVPLITFSQTKGLLFREARSASMCVWELKILDVERRVSVASVKAASDNQCVATKSVDIGRPPPGLKLVGKLALAAGHAYEVEVYADEGTHRSEPWTQPVDHRSST